MSDTIQNIKNATELVKVKGDDLIKYQVIVDGTEKFDVYTTEYSIGSGWDLAVNGKLHRGNNLFAMREMAYFTSEYYNKRD